MSLFARHLVAPSLATSGLFFASHQLMRPRTLHCEGSTLLSSSTTTTTRTQPLLDPHQFATGSVLGIASGLIFKRLGKLFFVILGGTYLVLRALGGATVPGLGQLRVPWTQMRQFILNRTTTSSSGSQVATGQAAESPIVTLLTKDLTFKLSFLATFMIGLVNT